MVSGLEDPSTVRLTLIDFGYADVKCGGTDLTRLAGSPEYAAPEVLSWLAEQGDPYDARCDVWSVGITAHVLVSASPSRRHITRAALRVSDQWVVPAAPPLLPIRRPSLCIDPPTRARPTALHPPLRAHRLPVCWQARDMHAQNWRLRADALLQQPGMGDNLSVDQHIALRLGPQPGMHSDALPAPAAQLQLPAPGAQLLLPAPGAQLQLQAPGEAQDGDEAPLPLGWSKAQDNSGRWYYHPSDWSGPAQWERPDARNVRQRLA